MEMSWVSQPGLPLTLGSFLFSSLPFFFFFKVCATSDRIKHLGRGEKKAPHFGGRSERRGPHPRAETRRAVAASPDPLRDVGPGQCGGAVSPLSALSI